MKPFLSKRLKNYTIRIIAFLRASKKKKFYYGFQNFQNFSRSIISLLLIFQENVFEKFYLFNPYTFAFSETIKRAKGTTRIEVQGSSNKASNQAEPVILIA